MKDNWEENMTDAIAYLGGWITELDSMADELDMMRKKLVRKVNELNAALHSMRNAWRMRDQDDLK